MIEELAEYLASHRDESYALLRRILASEEKLLTRAALLEIVIGHAGEGPWPGPTGRVLASTHVAVVEPESLWLATRARVGRWRLLRIHSEPLDVTEVSVHEFLAAQERAVLGRHQADLWATEIDLGPFNRDFPRLKEPRSIGHGVEFLNRHLSGRIFRDLEAGDQRLVDFLRVHSIRGRPVMLNGRLREVRTLRSALRKAERLLAEQPEDAEVEAFQEPLRELGFEPGWGRTVARTRDTMRLLSDVLEAPGPTRLQELLSRIPMITSIVILSPHGYFGQSGVLGLPDTGGQIVYILDQVRALEKDLDLRLHEQGFDFDPRILVVTRLILDAPGTPCDMPREPIAGTKSAVILRVPFRDENGRVVPQWISRFEVWPYLERFTEDVEREVTQELGGEPALIVGNYSDGNLVASLLSRRTGVTQCAIAHALEKSKYASSDVRWRDYESRYHFACQFTADLIAMNTADFIVTSTFQEIRGTDDDLGQYEGYGAFTLPGLYRVVNGINVFDPKFNVVSPGAAADIYFPFTESERRLTSLQDELEEMVVGEGGGAAVWGRFEEPAKPILFTMARLDHVKNVTGLVDWYGSCLRLRTLANLLVVGGHLAPEQSTDHEERAQIERMYELLDRHGLEGQVRWVEFQTERPLVGELYRFVAERRGIFCQPAFYEAYGLTVIEAMSSGLPVVATSHGGPSEIIENGVSGYHIDPYQGQKAAELIADVFQRAMDDPSTWDALSQAGLDRIRERYTWDLYARRMLTLARVYGFWRYVTNLERQETRRYLEMLYSLQYRPLAAGVSMA
jgi:sucrose synthase